MIATTPRWGAVSAATMAKVEDSLRILLELQFTTGR
jgi:hypothetical protein